MTIAEKVALKLSGRLGKKTLHVQWLDGSVTDLQINDDVRFEYDDKLRETVLNCGYNSSVCVRVNQMRCYEVEVNDSAPAQAIP